MKRVRSLPLPIRLTALALLLTAGAPLAAQYPTPRLTTVSPPGGKVGTTVEVTLGGADLDEVKALYISHPGIKAEYIPDPPPPKPAKGKPAPKPKPPGPPKFKLTIPPDTPLGTYDVRAIGKWGISNPRTLAVGDLVEVAEKEPNNDVDQAHEVELNTTINGVISSNVDVDYTRFAGKKGQTVVLYCAGEAIDSRLAPYLQLYDTAGRELVSSHHHKGANALIAYTLPADGEYVLRLTAYAYLVGSAEYFYRLSLSTKPWVEAAFPPVVPPGKATPVTFFGYNLPGGKPADGHSTLQQVAATVNAPPATDPHPLRYSGTLYGRRSNLDGFDYRLTNGAGSSNPIFLAYARAPLALADGTSSPDKPQNVTVPAEICGRIEKRGDRDCYAFAAKKGQVFVIEGFGDRLGSPVDLYFKIRRVDPKGKPVLGEYDDHPEVPSQVGRFYTHTNDPKTRLVVPSDGTYELLVSSRTADSVSSPAAVYRLSVRPEQPDFHLVAVDTDELSGQGLTLNQGANQEIQIVCFRHEGFDGPIALSVEGLPPGVTCPPQVLGPKLKQTVLVLTAADGAADWAGPITIKGKAQIDGKEVTREARTGCFVWPPAGNNPAFSRLSESLCLAVREKGPYGLGADKKELTVPLGGKVTLKLTIARHKPDFKSQVQLQRIAAPAITNGNPINVPNVNIPGNKNDVTVNFNIPTNAQAGTYSLVWRGQGRYQFVRDPKSKKKVNVQVRTVTPPIQVTVYNQVAEVSFAAPTVNAKAGTKTELVVKVKRLHGYTGPFDVQLQRPGGFPIGVPNVKIPDKANEAKLVLNVPKNVKPATFKDVVVRVTARVGRATMTHEGRVNVAFMP
jgi:hypothetical protein